MGRIMESIRKVGLFLFGIVLIVWGYRANAATKNEGVMSAKNGISPILKALEENFKQQQEAKLAEKAEKEELIKKRKAALLVEKKKAEKEEAKIEQQTVIEKETPEESSGTK